MKKINPLTAVVFFLLITLSSCKDRCGNLDTLAVSDALIKITFIGQSAEDYLIRDQQGTYKPDEISILDENLIAVPFDFVSRTG